MNRDRRSRLLRGLASPQEEGLNTLRYEVIDRSGSGAFERIRVRW
jgi:hypothetical protein